MVPDSSKIKQTKKAKQGKGTPSQGTSENKRRQSINTLAKTRVKSFKYNKVYLHKYRKENLEQKNLMRERNTNIYEYLINE